MCEINAYVAVIGSDKEEVFLEGVDTVRQEPDGVLYMRNLFGEERTFKGSIKEISFRKGRLLLVPA